MTERHPSILRHFFDYRLFRFANEDCSRADQQYVCIGKLLTLSPRLILKQERR